MKEMEVAQRVAKFMDNAQKYSLAILDRKTDLTIAEDNFIEGLLMMTLGSIAQDLKPDTLKGFMKATAEVIQEYMKNDPNNVTQLQADLSQSFVEVSLALLLHSAQERAKSEPPAFRPFPNDVPFSKPEPYNPTHSPFRQAEIQGDEQ